MANARLRLLYIAKILIKETDDLHSVGIQELTAHLKAYGINAERKTLYQDIETLQEYGLDIICERGVSNRYHIGERDFELPELKLMVDAVESSRFITPRKSKQLIKKLQSLTSKHEAKQLQRQVFVADRIKTQNEDVYYNIDAIYAAISEKKNIAFRYFDYDIQGTKVFRHNGERYVASPYGLTWVDENYYMIGYYERRNDISHFRVDKMNRIKVIDDGQIFLGENTEFNMADYVNKVFHMFGGILKTVELQFDKSLLNVMMDRFGRDAEFKIRDDNVAVVKTDVYLSPTFLSWIFQFGDKVLILSPPQLVKDMKNACQNQLKHYQ